MVLASKPELALASNLAQVLVSEFPQASEFESESASESMLVSNLAQVLVSEFPQA
jgi:hypothetical protein